MSLIAFVKHKVTSTDYFIRPTLRTSVVGPFVRCPLRAYRSSWHLLEVQLPFDHSSPSLVGRLTGFFLKGGKIYFNAPIGALFVVVGFNRVMSHALILFPVWSTPRGLRAPNCRPNILRPFLALQNSTVQYKTELEAYRPNTFNNEYVCRR